MTYRLEEIAICGQIGSHSLRQEVADYEAGMPGVMEWVLVMYLKNRTISLELELFSGNENRVR